MFSSASIKIFLLLAFLVFQSCSLWRGQTNATPSATPFVAPELKSDIPFSTKEPDVYQTEIVTNAEGFEEKVFAARNGASRLLILDFQGRTETAFLQTGANQNFLIARGQKIYTENKSEIGGAAGESLNDFLSSELVNRKTDAKFETLGAENNLMKYRVSFEAAQNSEAIIYVDEKIGLPVKQEFYSGGESKKLTTTTELKNFSLQADATLFEVPKDYRKISLKEFQDAVRRERTK